MNSAGVFKCKIMNNRTSGMSCNIADSTIIRRTVSSFEGKREYFDDDCLMLQIRYTIREVVIKLRQTRVPAWALVQLSSLAAYDTSEGLGVPLGTGPRA